MFPAHQEANKQQDPTTLSIQVSPSYHAWTDEWVDTQLHIIFLIFSSICLALLYVFYELVLFLYKKLQKQKKEVHYINIICDWLNKKSKLFIFMDEYVPECKYTDFESRTKTKHVWLFAVKVIFLNRWQA